MAINCVMRMNLDNKRILITAGPTWVPIDKVRVISNIATGQTGVLLASEARKVGAKVTLFLGPVNGSCLDKKIKLIRFRFFAELRKRLIRELRVKKYDYIIHAAAVADFQPVQFIRGKLASDKVYNLKLSPLPKIIADIRRLAPGSRLVMFKLESGVSESALIKRARQSLRTYRADLVIANRIYPRYKAFILDELKICAQVNSKKELAKKLIDLLKF